MDDIETPPAPPPPPVPPLVPFDDAWQLKTKSCTFEGVVTPGEVVSLNHIRDMTGQRNIYMVREGVKYGCSPDQIDGFKKYLSNLAYLIDQEGDRDDLEFEWASPLSGRGGRFFRLTGLNKELAMATFLYGSLLRQLAHQSIQDLLGLSPGSKALDPGSDEATAVLAAAVAQLRQAAGVYEYLAAQVLPALFVTIKGDRPGEIMSELNKAMSLMVQAEAAALTAFRAASKGSSNTVVASLQAGAAELFEKAAKLLRDHTGDYVIASDRLKRYLAIGASLATARAHKVMAGDLHAQLQAGAASRACVEAEQLLATCISAADIDGSWRTVLQQELEDVQRRKKPIESDRLIVYCQPMPHQAAPLPAAKVLVSAVEYTPERITNTAAEIARHT